MLSRVLGGGKSEKGKKQKKGGLRINCGLILLFFSRFSRPKDCGGSLIDIILFYIIFLQLTFSLTSSISQPYKDLRMTPLAPGLNGLTRTCVREPVYKCTTFYRITSAELHKCSRKSASAGAIGCTKNNQPMGVTVHLHCVESFEGLLQRCRRERSCSEF